jgi:dihydrofolate reductase
MAKLKCHLSISLDGYLAGPDQSLENPLGIGGFQLHQWAFGLAAWRSSQGLSGGEVNASTEVMNEHFENVGAVIMGRNMFGGHPGPWRADPPWTGWWGANPPFHAPVFVLTHHARAPLAMQGGTTFTFVTDGIESALGQARVAAAGKDILVSGGARTVQQYLAAGWLDEMTISVAPCFLHAGERLFDNLGGSALTLEPIRVVDAPGVTHIKYRVTRA